MKILIKIILVTIIGLICYGYYIKETNIQKGDAYIGIAIMSIVFILMPLFLIDRYRNKKLKSFIYKHEDGNQE
jgi:hypothetical protein